MTPTALIRVYLACSLSLHLSGWPFAPSSQTPDIAFDDQAGFGDLGLTEALIVQADTRPHLIALQRTTKTQDSEDLNVDGEA